MAKPSKARIGVALIALLALTGCGPLGDSDEDEAGEVLTDLVEARNQGEFGTVCDLLSSAALANFRRAGVGCEQTLRRRFGAGTTTTIRIDEVRVKGDVATVDATVSQVGGAGRAQTYRLVKEDGEWKFAS
jgi:hypothetical protein